jgi:pyruvate/2-oxoglutarate dehydrogenase complex dihydrolipoamide dehydrogenase (E3) component
MIANHTLSPNKFMSAATHYDAIVIGTGQAGPPLATRLAHAGMKTAVIEREHFGGTCVNDGCTPTKTLVASARAAHVVRTASAFGVEIAPDAVVSVDMKKVKARKDAVVKASVDGLTTWLYGTPDLTVFWGEASFVSPNIVKVGSYQLTAPKIFINTGGRASVPKIPGLDKVPFLTNSTIVELDSLPSHLIIIGGSYIGLEFAQMYRRFGCKVTVIETGARVIKREDPEFSERIQAILENEGVTVALDAKDLAVQGSGGDITVSYNVDASPIAVTGSHLLIAVGRTPNCEALNLPAAGIAVDAHGFIQVNDQLETNVPGIYALGDVNGRGAFTHTSYDDYEIVAGNLLENDDRRVTDRPVAYALFIDPPLGRVGLTETQVREMGCAAEVAVMPMTRVGRANERGETAGMMKILIDATSHQILGASFLGIEADEVIHVVMMAMAAKAPYTVLKRMMGIHPTVSELLPTLLGNLKPLEPEPIDPAA